MGFTKIAKDSAEYIPAKPNKRRKLTPEDFKQFKGYFYERVDSAAGLRRVYEPDGTLICQTGLDDVRDVIEEDIKRKANKSSGTKTGRFSDKEANESNTPKSGGFVPTTPKGLKDIAKRARERDEERSAERGTRKENVRSSRFPRGWRDIRAHLLQNKPVKVFRPQFFELLIQYIKENGEKPPAYNLWEKPREADASFRYDMQCCVARMSWMQCAKLTDIAVGVPIPTRDQSEAWHCLMQILFSAFDIVEDAADSKGTRHWVTINNRDALEEWPIMPRKRKTEKEDNEMFADENNRKMRASAREEDDEDDEAPRKRGGSDDEDDEDEAPKSKAKAKRKAKVEVDEDDEPPRRKKKAVKDDEDEDDEDEKPTRGKKKKVVEDDDEDEEDEKPARKRKAVKDEDEDDEDEKPTRKRKSAKDEDGEDEVSAPKRRAAKADVGLKDGTLVAKIKERERGGPKSKLLALIPKKGITIKELTADAKEEDLPVSKVKLWVQFLMRYDFVKVKE